MIFALAVNYGSRAEIVRAAKELAREAVAGELAIDSIDADAVAEKLIYATGFPILICLSVLQVSCASRIICFGSSRTLSSM